MRTVASSALVLAIAVTAGCGGGKPKLYPVTGKVTYQNKPAAGATVVFHPKGDNTPQAIRPFGVVKEDGTYSLASGADADSKGAPAGEYEVAITWDAPAKAAKPPGSPAGWPATSGAKRKTSSADGTRIPRPPD